MSDHNLLSPDEFPDEPAFNLPKYLREVSYIELPRWWPLEHMPDFYEDYPIWEDFKIRVRVEKHFYEDGGKAMTLHPIFKQRPIPEDIKCKVCGSKNVVRFGTYKEVQRYRCKNCGATFMGKNTLRGGQIPIPVIADAVSLYYEGLSLRAITRQLNNTYGMSPSNSNVYYWVVKYSQKANREFEETTVGGVGNIWVADETVLKMDGRNTWFWDCIDSTSRFLLASHISTSRRIGDARTLMRKAFERAGKSPKIVLTDKLAAYLDGVELTFGADSTHIQSGPFKLQHSTRDIERFHGTLKQRTKVMRGLQNKQTAKIILDGWLVNYNFFRPHGGLDGKTPAQVARVSSSFPYKGWKDVVSSEAEYFDSEGVL